MPMRFLPHLEQLEDHCLPSVAIPADFPAGITTVESFESLVVDATNNPQTPSTGFMSPGTSSVFTFGSGVQLTKPIPNPGSGSNGVAIGDWSKGSSPFALGTNGSIGTAADVPNGTSYLAIDSVASTSGPVGFTFPKPVGAVGAYVTASGGAFITLRAYDAANQLIESTTIPAVQRSAWTAKNASAFIGLRDPGIKRVEFSGDFLVLDLLQSRPLDPSLVGTPQFAAGADAGGGAVVKQYAADGTLLYNLDAFPGFTGGVRVAEADFNNDSVPDIAVVSGPGMPAELKLFDGQTHALLLDTPIFEGFTGGAFVAVGDITGDGTPDIILSPDVSGGPRIVILRGGDYKMVASFFGIDDPNFRGGARVAVGDMNRDGRPDLAISAGFGGGPRVAVFDGTTLTSGTPVKLFSDFFVFEPVLRNGAYLAVGDVDGDGYGDLIAGAGPGGGPRVLTLSGVDLLAGKAGDSKALTNFFGGDVNNRSGIRVAAKNLDGDLQADIVVGDGSGNGSRVSAYLGKSFSNGSAPAQLGFDAFTAFSGGVFVG
jgi:hypothetical protein